MDSLIQTGPEA